MTNAQLIAIQAFVCGANFAYIDSGNTRLMSRNEAIKILIAQGVFSSPHPSPLDGDEEVKPSRGNKL